MTAHAPALGRGSEPAPEEAPRIAERSGLFAGRGWRLYLVLAALLVPFVASIGPAQLAILDAFNIMALAAFAFQVLARRARIALPLIVPVGIIATASLIATTNAVAPFQSIVTMAQDAYLYVWFVMLVNVALAQGGLKGLRVAWMLMSAAIALYGAIGLMHTFHYGFAQLLSPSGNRAQGTFGNANFFADYLIVSFFIVVSLAGEVPWIVRWPAMGALLLGLLASKSLGSILALIVASVVWFVVRALTRSASRLSLGAMVLVLGGLTVLGGYLVKESGIANTVLQRAASESVVGRFGKSSEGREHIWGELLHRFEQSPLGIGPGNSSALTLSIENRERRGGSIQAKEAHNDYLGYLAERGPIALLAMISMTVLAFRWIRRGWKAVRSRRWREGQAGLWAAALAGGLTAGALHSFTGERLHFRHYWLFLGLLYALSAWMATSEPRAIAPPGRGLSGRGGSAPPRVA